MPSDNVAIKEQARQIMAALDSVTMDVVGSADAFGYGGGRELSTLAADARDGLEDD